MEKERKPLVALMMVTAAVYLAGAYAVKRLRATAPAPAPSVSTMTYDQMKAIVDDCEYRHIEIGTLDDRIENLRKSHHDQPPELWGDDAELQFWKDSAERLALKTRYNQMAATYNAEMSRTNRRYTRDGEVPQDQYVLPPSIPPYEDAPSPDAGPEK